jgi:hypothetical protein
MMYFLHTETAPGMLTWEDVYARLRTSFYKQEKQKSERTNHLNNSTSEAAGLFDGKTATLTP